MADSGSPQVGIIMGSLSDWDTMRHAAATLEELGIAHESRVISAHRTPELLDEYVLTVTERGLRVVIAGAGGAAHLAGVVASRIHLPVLGVPMERTALSGMDSLLSTVQMPSGVPVATFSIGKAGAINAALFAAAILAGGDPDIERAWKAYRAAQARRIAAIGDPAHGESA